MTTFIWTLFHVLYQALPFSFTDFRAKYSSPEKNRAHSLHGNCGLYLYWLEWKTFYFYGPQNAYEPWAVFCGRASFFYFIALNQVYQPYVFCKKRASIKMWNIISLIKVNGVGKLDGLNCFINIDFSLIKVISM